MSLNLYSKESVDSLLSAKIGDAPSDGNQYVRKNAAWAILSGGGGGASWGTITGSITDQTDLISYFGNYLPLTGATLSGGLTLSSYGVTFSDSSIQTTAAVAFTGGSITSSIYWNDGTVSTSMNDGYFLVQDSSSSAYGVLYENGMEVGDGTNTLKIHGTGITFADSTTQSTAFIANTFLPLSGGTMTGALQLGGDLNADGYNITNANFSSSAGQVNCQNLTLTNGDGGSVTFADGSVQTTAASGGYSALNATTDAIAACFSVNSSTNNFTLIGMAGTSCLYGGKFTSGSSYLIGIGSASPTYFSGSFDPNGYAIGSATASFSPTGSYLYYSQDGGSTWTQSSFTLA